MSKLPDNRSDTNILSESFLRFGYRFRYPKNTFIFLQRDQAEKIFLLEAGIVKQSFFSTSGAEKIVSFTRPGDFFGEYRLSDKPYGITATAYTDCIVIGFNRSQAVDLIRSNPDFATMIADSMSGMIRSLGRQVICNTFYNIFGQVGHALLNLSYQMGMADRDPVNLEITHHELATFIGATRVSVTKVITYLKSKNLIINDRGKITIVDRARLKEWVREQAMV